ncbi:MAG: terminase small subunit [Phycisphaeraceae bacterium]|nr:terminase small subunit [Phycisphaeraceae bacterium]
MKTLTPKQRRFVDLYVHGGDGVSPGSAAAAWRAACPGAKARSSAYRMLRQAAVQMAIQAAQDELRRNYRITLEQHLTRLDEVRSAAMEAGNYSAAVRAEVALGQACGFYTARSLNLNVGLEVGSSANLENRIAAMVAEHPSLAGVLQRALAGGVIESQAEGGAVPQLASAPVPVSLSHYPRPDFEVPNNV